MGSAIATEVADLDTLSAVKTAPTKVEAVTEIIACQAPCRQGALHTLIALPKMIKMGSKLSCQEMILAGQVVGDQLSAPTEQPIVQATLTELPILVTLVQPLTPIRLAWAARQG